MLRAYIGEIRFDGFETIAPGEEKDVTVVFLPFPHMEQDKERRKKLAFHLRQLSVGLTTNDDFEVGVMDDVANGWLPEQYYRAKETKCDPILETCWGLYDDTRQHKLVGRDKLPDESLKTIARCILFSSFRP